MNPSTFVCKKVGSAPCFGDYQFVVRVLKSVFPHFPRLDFFFFFLNKTIVLWQTFGTAIKMLHGMPVSLVKQGAWVLVPALLLMQTSCSFKSAVSQHQPLCFIFTIFLEIVKLVF